jgi:hypothetical protein
VDFGEFYRYRTRHVAWEPRSRGAAVA